MTVGILGSLVAGVILLLFCSLAPLERPLLARFVIGLACAIWPRSAPAIVAAFDDELDVRWSVTAVGRAWLFVSSVFAFSRAQAKAEQDSRTRTGSLGVRADSAASGPSWVNEDVE